MPKQPNKPPMKGPRKPPRPDLAIVEQFVAAGGATEAAPQAEPPVKLTAKPRKKGAILTRADGRQVEQLTVYLRPDLAQALRISAVTQREDMSDLVSAALEAHLG